MTDVTPERDLATWPEPVEEAAETAPGKTPAYDRPPLHQPMGSTYSDVGMPYPLPQAPAAPPPAAHPAKPQATPRLAPFFESSFAAPPATPPSDSAFPETSFGRDAGT